MGLGDEVAVGLIGGSEELQRLRIASRGGVMGRLWEHFRQQVLLPPDAPMKAHHTAANLALVAAVERRPELVSDARDHVLDLARRPHWMHAQAGCIGLEGSGWVRQVCMAADWLWPVLGQGDRMALLEAVLAKGMENLSPSPEGVQDPGDGRGQLLLARRMDRNDPHCLHPVEPQVNNWDLWLGTSMLMAAAMAERAWLKPQPGQSPLPWGRFYQVGYDLDAERISRWRELATERITTALAAQLGPDGDYAEGNNYAGYGGRAIATGLTVLQRTTGTDLWLPAMAKMPLWLRNQFPAELGFGKTNFNDARIDFIGGIELAAWAAARSHAPAVQAVAWDLLEAADPDPSPIVLLTFDPDLPSTPATLSPSSHYRHSGQVVWRTSTDRDGVFLSLVSGAHGGAHQHRDRNTFFLSAYGEHLLVDTGDSRYADPPDPEFPDTVAHNCLLIDGRGQLGDNNDIRAGQILACEHAEAVSTLLAEAGPCYDGIDSCRRRVVFVRPDVFVMSDRVEGPCTTLTWLAQGHNPDNRATWRLGENTAILTRPEARLHVFFLEPVTAIGLSLGTLDGEHRHTLRLAADVAGDTVTTLLVPTRPADPEPVLSPDADGTFRLSVGDREVLLTPGTDTLTVNGTDYPR